MFDRDKWLEILHTILQNPLRTFLTGVSVALGIFILVVMQGLGFGLQNGVMRQIQDDAVNSIWIYSDVTTLPYRGTNPGKRIRFTNADLEYVSQKVEGVSDHTARLGFWGAQMSFGNETMAFSARGIHPGHQALERTDIKLGRYINEADITDRKKVVVIGQTIVDDLFRGQNPIGEYMSIMGVRFMVVGTFEKPNGRWENRQGYLPISTAQRVFGETDRIGSFAVGTGEAPLHATIRMVEDIKAYLYDKHGVHPDDSRAITVYNNNEEFRTYLNVFTGIRLFIWMIGSFTLMAGMIGVGNIMSIVVKERTKEIGIRKALGANPMTILGLIVQEATFLTLVSGSFGLVLGVVLLESISDLIDHEFFSNPSVDFRICAVALGLLIISGVLSGLVPAFRAVKVSPVEALRDE